MHLIWHRIGGFGANGGHLPNWSGGCRFSIVMYIENRYGYHKESEGTILINFTPHQLVTIKTRIVCTEANTHALIIIVTIAGKIQTKVELVANLMRCGKLNAAQLLICLLYTSPSPRDATLSRMPSSA